MSNNIWSCLRLYPPFHLPSNIKNEWDWTFQHDLRDTAYRAALLRTMHILQAISRQDQALEAVTTHRGVFITCKVVDNALRLITRRGNSIHSLCQQKRHGDRKSTRLNSRH